MICRVGTGIGTGKLAEVPMTAVEEKDRLVQAKVIKRVSYRVKDGQVRQIVMRLRVAHVVCPPEAVRRAPLTRNNPTFRVLGRLSFSRFSDSAAKCGSVALWLCGSVALWLCGCPLSMTDAKEQPQHLPLMYPHDTAT